MSVQCPPALGVNSTSSVTLGISLTLYHSVRMVLPTTSQSG